MAFLAQDDKQQQSTDPNQQSGQGAQSGSGGGFVGGASSGSTSTAPSTAGVGAGGTGGWTNIQSYLQANQNSNTGQYLQNSAQDAYNKENQNFQDQSGQAKQQAQTQADSENVNQDAATKMINNAAQNYSYNNQTPSNNAQTGTVPGQTTATGNGQSDQYNQALQPVQQLLNAKYSGPTSFSYGMGSDAQKYNTGLSDDTAFHGLMNNIYNQAAGGNMNSGALALQQQIDQDNPNLNQTRQNLAQQFTGLQNQEQQGTADTDAAVKAAQQQFGTNQANFRNTLTGIGTQDKSAIDQAVQGFNANTNGGPSSSTVDFSSYKPAGSDGNQSVTDSAASNLYQSNPLFQKMLNDYAQFQGGGANEQNVSGVDQQRNAYNVVQNALGLGGNIGFDPNAAQAGKYTINNDQLNKDVSTLQGNGWNASGMDQGAQDYANYIHSIFNTGSI